MKLNSRRLIGLMERGKKIWKKTIRIFIWIFIIIPLIIILFISPLTKYLIQKYDVEWTGREIQMDWVYVNPFTGYAYFSNLIIHESKSDSVFFSSNGVGANFSVWKLFSKTYEVNRITLYNPHISFIVDSGKFNLSDVIRKFSPDDNRPSKKSPVKLNILDIKINNGEIHYRETITPVHLYITKVNIESPGIRWNSDTIAAKYSFLSGVGKGGMDGDFIINTKNLDYYIAAAIHHLDLGFFNQYLKDLSNSGNFRASLEANLKTNGNFRDAQNLNAKGKLELDEFHFGRDTLDDCASFHKLVVGIYQLSPNNHKYIFDSLLLARPYFKFEQYDQTDNLQVLFMQNGALPAPGKFNLVVEIGKYIKRLSVNFLASYYRINNLAISDGDVRYNNYSMNEKFSLAASPLSITADSIDKKNKRVEFNFKSAIQPYGNITLWLSIDPNDSTNFDMNYQLQKLSLPMFNPFLLTYTSFPLDRGTLELNGKWAVKNGFIESTNHLIVIDPRVSKRVRRKDSKWVPLPLIMALVRERGNVIDYEIPITGNIKSPTFHLKDVLTDLVKNIFIKPPTFPYRMEVRNAEEQVEKSVSIKWEMRQYTFSDNQEKFVRKMADFLEQNPQASITIQPVEYAEKEKEYILFYEAKKKYFLKTHGNHSFSEADSLEVDRMSLRDSSFMQYLRKFCHDSTLYTIQQKCYCFVGDSIVEAEFHRLEKNRERNFRFYFVQNGTSNRVKILPAENNIPYNGFSYFKIEYNGSIPESLAKAYLKMKKLDEGDLRNRYFRLRRKINQTTEI
jgi:hypothetical protein